MPSYPRTMLRITPTIWTCAPVHQLIAFVLVVIFLHTTPAGLDQVDQFPEHLRKSWVLAWFHSPQSLWMRVQAACLRSSGPARMASHGCRRAFSVLTTSLILTSSCQYPPHSGYSRSMLI